MKNTLLLLGACLAGTILHAQQTEQTYQPRSNSVYFAIKPGAAFLFAGPRYGPLNLSFPYTVTDSAGNNTNSTFQSKAIRPFRSLITSVPFELEVGTRHFFISAGIEGVVAGSDGNGFTLGYGRSFFVGKIALRPSIGIEYAYYFGEDASSPLFLGSIPNQNSTITFDGISAGPTYTVTTTYYNRYGPSTQSTTTYSVKELDIFYGQKVWLFKPKLAFGSSPFQHRLHWWIFDFHWEAFAGYAIALSEKGEITFRQNGDHPIADKSLKDQALLVKYNNNPTRSAPYVPGGLLLGCNFYYTLHK